MVDEAPSKPSAGDAVPSAASPTVDCIRAAALPPAGAACKPEPPQPDVALPAPPLAGASAPAATGADDSVAAATRADDSVAAATGAGGGAQANGRRSTLRSSHRPSGEARAPAPLPPLPVPRQQQLPASTPTATSVKRPKAAAPGQPQAGVAAPAGERSGGSSRKPRARGACDVGGGRGARNGRSSAKRYRTYEDDLEQEQEDEAMLGCARCCFLSAGCGRCRKNPTVLRPFARWKPDEGVPQEGLASAPIFHPTPEQFQDPYAYITSIYPQAARYGLCRIVPPKGWDPPFALAKGTNGAGAESFRFTTRRQFTSHLCLRLVDAEGGGGGGGRERGARGRCSGNAMAGAAAAADAAAGSSACVEGHAGTMLAVPASHELGELPKKQPLQQEEQPLQEEQHQQPKQQQEAAGAVAAAAKAAEPAEPATAAAPAEAAEAEEEGGDAFNLASSDDEFGFVATARPHTLRSFAAYADWAKRRHFSALPPHAPASAAKRPRLAASACGVAAGAGGGALLEPSPSVAQVEAEFWRIVESPESGRSVEALYGQDLDSGRHGSGFPLPPWRGLPRDARGGRHLQANGGRDGCYARHGWNVNNMPRQRASVLRHLPVEEPVTGVMVPWLYVGSCLSAFCWHVEDHALYSINYLHTGAPKVWYGVPAYATELLEAAMRDCLPHLFEADPTLLHKLVTLVSPNELRARGVPIYRMVQEAGSFVVTMPNAYHAGFNTGFNVAEAVNFAPPNWLPYGSDVVRKYRRQRKALTISHDQLLLSLVSAAPAVALAHGLGGGCGGDQQPQAPVPPPQQSSAPSGGRGSAGAGGKAAAGAAGAGGSAAAAVAQVRQRSSGGGGARAEPHDGADSSELSDSSGSDAESERSSLGLPPDASDGGDASGCGDESSGSRGSESDAEACRSAGDPWAVRWSAGVAAKDVDRTALLYALGELVVRVEEEEGRRRAAAAAGIVEARRMAGGGCAHGPDGAHTDTHDADCGECACDLHMSAVVSAARPGRAVCPEHAAALGVPGGQCVLLYRHTIPELQRIIFQAVALFPDCAAYIGAAQQRSRSDPWMKGFCSLGPLVELDQQDQAPQQQGSGSSGTAADSAASGRPTVAAQAPWVEALLALAQQQAAIGPGRAAVGVAGRKARRQQRRRAVRKALVAARAALALGATPGGADARGEGTRSASAGVMEPAPAPVTVDDSAVQHKQRPAPGCVGDTSACVQGTGKRRRVEGQQAVTPGRSGPAAARAEDGAGRTGGARSQRTQAELAQRQQRQAERQARREARAARRLVRQHRRLAWQQQ